MRLGRRRAGGAALLVSALVLFLLMLGVGMVDAALLARMRRTQDEARRVELQALVDAAMAEALAALAQDPAHPGFAPHPFAGGLISSRVVPVGPARYTVRAGARQGSRVLQLDAEVERPWGRPLVRGWRFARPGPGSDG